MLEFMYIEWAFIMTEQNITHLYNISFNTAKLKFPIYINFLRRYIPYICVQRGLK